MNKKLDNILIPIYGYVTTYKEDKLAVLHETEKGLGLKIVPEHGINNLTYIQLDISELISKVAYKTIPIITINSGNYIITGSAIPGTIGTTLYTSKSIDESIPIPYFGTYKYIAIMAFGDSIIKIKSIEFEIEVENFTTI